MCLCLAPETLIDPEDAICRPGSWLTKVIILGQDIPLAPDLENNIGCPFGEVVDSDGAVLIKSDDVHALA